MQDVVFDLTAEYESVQAVEKALPLTHCAWAYVLMTEGDLCYVSALTDTAALYSPIATTTVRTYGQAVIEIAKLVGL